MTVRGWRPALGVLSLLGVSACGGQGAPPPERGSGDIRIGTVVDGLGPGADYSFISASFAQPGTRTPCEVSEHGDCLLLDCVPGSGLPRPDAGELTVETADGRFLQRLQADADGSYSYSDGTGAFLPLDAVSARFGGGAVPAFEVGGELPTPMVLTEPVAPAGEDVVVDPSSDLTLRWAPVAGSVVSVSFDGLASKQLRCSAPSTSGVLTVSSVALGELRQGPLDVLTVRSVNARAGNYDVVLVLMAGVEDANGAGLRFTLDL